MNNATKNIVFVFESHDAAWAAMRAFDAAGTAAGFPEKLTLKVGIFPANLDACAKASQIAIKFGGLRVSK